MNLFRTFAVYVSIISIFFSNCDTTEPPKLDTRKLILTFEDASCTEVWVALETENLQLPAEINLVGITEGDTVSQVSILNTQDSLLYIDSLLPNQTYTIQSFIHSSNQPEISSNKISVTTMDTTSHNFTWETFTFGEHSSSVLYDVAIIDENNIWAVGEIYLNDSLGQPDPTRYNLAVWNGIEWSIKRVPYYYQGQPFYHPIQSVFAFGPNDIWFCGNGVIHWDGNDFLPVSIPSSVWGPYQMNKMWGTSGNDLYVVGNNGSIAHYNGTSWQKISSGTDLSLNEIWGDYDEELNELEILVAGGNILVSTERIILKIINGNQVQQISTEGTIEYPLSGVWFKSGLKYYVAGDGVYTSISLKEQWQNLNLPNYYIFSIKGTDFNDIVVAGGAGYVGHFNGVNWKNYLGDGLNEITGNYYSTSIKGNTVAAVGNSAEGEAIAVIGKR